MDRNISPLLFQVNKPAVLTAFNLGNKFAVMRYGERLRIARNARGLKQAALSDASGVSQSLISQLETSLTATGSEYTNRLARALEISADWLADEIGEMTPTYYQTTDPKIIAVAKIMEPMPEYGKNAAVKDVAEVAELIAQAKGGDGTDG